MSNFLWKIYLSRFFDSFILIGVLFSLFFSQQGLDPFQISILISIWSLTTILTEVPFGVLADTYFRRNLLIIGLMLRAIGFGFWIMGGFVNFAIGFVLWGLKNTLTSGTLEGLVYDELSYYKKEGEYEVVNGKMSAFFSLGLFLSAIFGGVVAHFSFQLVIIASIAASLLAALILSTIKSVKSVESTGEVNYWSTLSHAMREIRSSKNIIYVISFICIIFAAFGAMDEYWALVYAKLNLSESTVGILVALVYGIGSVAGYSIKLFNKAPKYLGYVLIATGAIFYLIFGLTRSVVLLPIVFFGIYLFQIASIKLEAELQHHITSHQRSTISSIKSLLFELVYMGYVLLFGFVGSQYGILATPVVAGAILLVSITIIPLLSPKKVGNP